MIELILSIVIMILPYLFKIVDWGIKQGKIRKENQKELIEIFNEYTKRISNASQGIDDELQRQHDNLLKEKKS